MATSERFDVVRDPFGYWPNHMYVNGVLQCQATDCTHSFDHNKPENTPFKHFTEPIPNLDINSLCHKEHQVLAQMHKLVTCLFCGDTDHARSFRALLFHNTIKHPSQKTMATIEGFVFHVRNSPDAFSALPQYRGRTFTYVYQRLKLKLQTYHSDKFLAVTNFKHLGVADKYYRDVLTKDRASTYWPTHTDNFLLHLEFDSKRKDVTRQQWEQHRNDLRKLYCDGEI